MLGEVYAVLSAACFGVAGAAVAKGAPAARGDNGVFLSILLTLVLSSLLWLGRGGDLDAVEAGGSLVAGLFFFVAAGLLSTVFGRLTNFRSIALAGVIRASLFRRLIPVFSTALAFVILGERYSPLALAGFLIILSSIALAMWVRTPSPENVHSPFPATELRLGLLFGAASAFCYALAYIARSLAMEHLPNAAFGAFVGALTGVIWYMTAATVSDGYRLSLTSVFRTSGPWQWLAALGMSLGQVLLFFALFSAPVAVVAVIGSLEIFVGAYLAAFLFRSEPRPGRAMILATLLALFGVSIVALN